MTTELRSAVLHGKSCRSEKQVCEIDTNRVQLFSITSDAGPLKNKFVELTSESISQSDLPQLVFGKYIEMQEIIYCSAEIQEIF